MTNSFLQRFTNIRREEVGPALVAGLFFFCVLTALMVIRPAREALGMQRGIDALRWLFVGTVLVTLLVNPVFGWLVSRFRRLVFVAATYLFFAIGLVAFYLLLVLTPESVGQRTGQVFYVWFSVFNLFTTMLFWALMADRFTLEQSKRLFGAIAVGGTLGAIFGPWLAGQLAKPLGTPVLLLVAAGFLLLALGAAWWITRLRPEVAQSGVVREEHAVIGGSAWQGLQSVFRSPYLLGICGYVLILAVMVTFLYFTRLQMVAALGTDVDTRTTMFAHIDLITQVTTLVLQLIITGHLMKRLGVAVTLALLPLTAVLGFVGLAIVGSLAALIAFEASFRAVQRGIMRPARETLFTVVPRADRYKAKAFIDTFVYRTGDLVGAQTEGLLGRLGMGLGALAAVALPLAGGLLALDPRTVFANPAGLITRTIPGTSEQLPIVGLGSSATFAQVARSDDVDALRAVLKQMVDLGGKVFDTAPSYGASEEVAGRMAQELGIEKKLFWATKLNVASRGGGSADPKAAREQLEASFRRSGKPVIDVVQVHNLGDLPTQLPILREYKEKGRIRYIGTTTTFEPQYADLVQLMRKERIDFIGIDYAVDNRRAEETILPLARDKGIGVLVYLPFGRTRLWQRVKGREVPDWAREFDANSWAQFFLKYVASHPAVTAITPATSKPSNMADNIGAAMGRLPDAAMRKRMIQHMEELP